MAGSTSLTEVLRESIESRLLDVHTALPAKIKSYDRTTHTAEVVITVQRTVTRADGSELLEEVPPIPNVPVAWPHGSSGSANDNRFYIEFPLSAGDEGMLLFSEAAMGHLRESGQLSPPGDLRRHSLSAGVFFPCGLRHFDAYEDGGPVGLIIVPNERHLSVRRAGDSDDWVALAGLVDDQFTALKTAISGAAVLAGDGGAAFKAALLTALSTWPESVASGTLKAGPT